MWAKWGKLLDRPLESGSHGGCCSNGSIAQCLGPTPEGVTMQKTIAILATLILVSVAPEPARQFASLQFVPKRRRH
jgi:hypothetical protein